MIEPNYLSFRDPDALVIKKDGLYFRYLMLSYKAEYDHLMQSGLYQKLIDQGLMIAHEEVAVDSIDTNIYKQIFPQQISFQSYPFEWSFSQWKKAILSFLTINRIALQHGMILKDATPYNFFLQKGKAVLLDTSSFQFFKENDVWIAYRQFCEEFLGPLALMKYNGARWAKLLSSHIHGLPLDFISKQLSLKSKFNLTCLIHIHLHKRFHATQSKSQNKKPEQHGFSTAKLLNMLELMESGIGSWETAYPYEHHWVTYYEEDIESPAYLADKESKITEWLNETKPKTVLDLGANTGLFSFMAAKNAERVVAVEFDEVCVDKIESTIQNEGITNITALVADISESTGGLGILNREYTPLVQRGESTMVMGLALIHHLCITKYFDLAHIAELFATLSKQYVIIEFIPKEDPKVQLLLANRKDVFENYREEIFLKEFSEKFTLIGNHGFSNSLRKIFLFRKKLINEL